jgi:hypothetical protein
MKSRHNQECKGLMVQIRYLKAKYTRESNLRCMVIAQKDYVVSLLACFEQRFLDFFFPFLCCASR